MLPHSNDITGDRLASALVEHDSTDIVATWASDTSDLRAAQRLRHDVFVKEMGATPARNGLGNHDCESDRFDAFCDHLLIKTKPDREPGQVIGTYRVMRPAQALRAGGFYSDTEFDLTPIAALRSGALELGRTCVHPAWRNGTVIMAMWRALGSYMLAHQLDTMIGCASISLADQGYAAASLWERLRHTHLAAPHWQVHPRDALPVDDLAGHAPAEKVTIPPLIKGYLRCGARVLGPPARDLVFNTADLPMMLRFGDLSARYRNHFLGR